MKISLQRHLLGLFAITAVSATALAVMPTVKVVPWVPSDPLIPHDTYSGKVITLKGTSDVSGANIQWIWDFGDGSAPASGTVTDPYVVEARHAYTGAVGTVFTARLTVRDTNTGESASKPYYIRLGAQELPIEVNVAIDEGLWYLHKTQNRFTSGGVALGDWTSSKYGGYANSTYTSVSAVNVTAFEGNGHLETGSPDNPYTETVQRAMRRLFQRLASISVGLQSNGLGTYNCDQNGNGIGIVVNDGYEYYQGGMIMDAIIASGTPAALTTTGPASVIGRTYKNIVQDMVDAYLYAQYDGSGGGGWRYSANQYPDNSACQWAAIGLIPAEREWGCVVPLWAKQWNAVWLNASQYNSPGSFYHGAFGYQPGYWFPWGPYATTPSGMVQMAMDGIGRDNAGWPSWNAAETFIRDNFNNSGGASSAIKSYYYGLFSFVKSMLLHDANGDGIAEPIVFLRSSTPGVRPLDWYAGEAGQDKHPTTDDDTTINGVARTLVNDQSFGTYWGYWFGHDYEGTQRYFETAWAILMLNRTIFDPGVPVAVPKAIPNPGVVAQLITLDGSASYHKAPGRIIDSWEWDVDGDGVFDASGPIITVSFTALGTYPVKLRVTDDGSPEKSAESFVSVVIEVPPLPPTAQADGPYVFCPQAQPWYLDARFTNNPDEGKHEVGPYPGDTIQEYAWDLDGDGAFDDAFGATPDVTAFFTAAGPGSYLVQLRVTDTTAASFPSSGYGDLSDTDTAVVIVKAPTDPACDCVDLSATLQGKKVNLSWTAMSGAAQYAVYRGTIPGGPYLKLALVAGLTYTDNATISGTTYYYVVRPAALNGNELCQSNEVEATPVCDPPVVNCAPTTKCSNLARYYRELTASSTCYGRMQLKIWVGDSATPAFKAGPFKTGDVVRISKAATATSKPGTTACVAGIITVKGQALVWAEDPMGDTSGLVVCP